MEALNDNQIKQLNFIKTVQSLLFSNQLTGDEDLFKNKDPSAIQHYISNLS